MVGSAPRLPGETESWRPHNTVLVRKGPLLVTQNRLVVWLIRIMIQQIEGIGQPIETIALTDGIGLVFGGCLRAPRTGSELAAAEGGCDRSLPDPLARSRARDGRGLADAGPTPKGRPSKQYH